MIPVFYFYFACFMYAIIHYSTTTSIKQRQCYQCVIPSTLVYTVTENYTDKQETWSDELRRGLKHCSVNGECCGREDDGDLSTSLWCSGALCRIGDDSTIPRGPTTVFVCSKRKPIISNHINRLSASLTLMGNWENTKISGTWQLYHVPHCSLLSPGEFIGTIPPSGVSALLFR